uniref:Zinc finger GRF-type domain-containing protein n=1 Tax=Brassica campestris TaxID=3711 RepID=A0A3P6C3A1_BRACM|nr:unnamed protein product [Brassica rapa]
MEKVKMEVGSGSGSSLSQRSRRRFSCLRLCHCGLPAKIRQAWTEKNPGRHFYGCPFLSFEMNAITSLGSMKRLVQNGKGEHCFKPVMKSRRRIK